MKYIIIIVLFVISSCSNFAYRRVATDVNRTPEHKQILNQICSQTFPASPPIYKEGKTIIKTDTFSRTDTVTTLQDNEVVRYVYKTNTVTNTLTKTDTIYKDNPYTTSALNDQITELKQKETECTIITAQKDASIKEWRKLFAIATGIIVLALIAFIVRMYLKFKPV